MKFVKRLFNPVYFMVTREKYMDGKREVMNAGLFDSKCKAEQYVEGKHAKEIDRPLPTGSYQVYRIEEWKLK